MIADEPFSGVDASGVDAIVEDIRGWAANGLRTLLVTHDVEEAILLADRILVLKDGRIGFDTRVNLPHPRRTGGAEFDGLRDILLRELGVPASA